MPLGILLALVVGGIAGITLLLHVSGRSKPFLLTPESAHAQWLRQFPDDDILEVTVAHNGCAALIQTNIGPGLLWSFGADTVGRHLVDYDLQDLPEGFRIKFHDFSAPKTLVRLDKVERSRWRDLMEPA